MRELGLKVQRVLDWEESCELWINCEGCYKTHCSTPTVQTGRTAGKTSSELRRSFHSIVLCLQSSQSTQCTSVHWPWLSALWMDNSAMFTLKIVAQNWGLHVLACVCGGMLPPVIKTTTVWPLSSPQSYVWTVSVLQCTEQPEIPWCITRSLYGTIYPGDRTESVRDILTVQNSGLPSK